MEFKVSSRSKRVQKFIEHIMPSMIKQLGLENSRKFVLIETSHCGDNYGYTVPLEGLDSFVIVLKPRTKWQEMGVTLAHEMVHVRQLAKGILKAENGKKYWRGKLYSKKTKYLDMPWELDALAKQDIIFRRALED
jgi:hypothetical protein